jgi:DNA-binding transcriptional MerR regulator
MTAAVTKKKHNITDEWLSGVDVADGRVFTIGETSSLCCNVKPHVLRYWESQFPSLNPVRRNDRRYYKREDIITIRNIYNLVHLNRYTVEGARKFLSSNNDGSDKSVFDGKKSQLLNVIRVLENIDQELVAD